MVGTRTENEERKSYQKLFLRQSHGNRSTGSPHKTWLDDVYKDLQHLGIINWREVAMDRIQWKRLIDEAKTSDYKYCRL